VQALLGRNITIYGDGLQTRSFCYVDDLIEGLIRLMDTSPDVIGPINLGNPEEVTIIDLAKQIIDLTGSKSCLVHRGRPDDDPYRRRPDISKASELLDWTPKTPRHQGLRQTILYFNELLAQPGVREAVEAGLTVGEGS
jgi:UDP-glucuronate decarboxylase